MLPFSLLKPTALSLSFPIPLLISPSLSLFLSHSLSSFLLLEFPQPFDFLLNFFSIFKSLFRYASYSLSQPFAPLSFNLSLSLVDFSLPHFSSYPISPSLSNFFPRTTLSLPLALSLYLSRLPFCSSPFYPSSSSSISLSKFHSQPFALFLLGSCSLSLVDFSFAHSASSPISHSFSNFLHCTVGLFNLALGVSRQLKIGFGLLKRQTIQLLKRLLK